MSRVLVGQEFVGVDHDEGWTVEIAQAVQESVPVLPEVGGESEGPRRLAEEGGASPAGVPVDDGRRRVASP